MQSGMRETREQEICLEDTTDEALEALLSFVYGRLDSVSVDVLLPLFKLADSHEVSTSLALVELNYTLSLTAINAGMLMVTITVSNGRRRCSVHGTIRAAPA